MNKQASVPSQVGPQYVPPAEPTPELLSRTDQSQLLKYGLETVVERIVDVARFTDAFEKETNADPVYSEEHKKKQVAEQANKDITTLSNRLELEYLGGAVDAHNRKTKRVQQRLSLQGGLDATVLSNAALLIAQEKFSIQQLVKMKDDNLLRAALILPVTRYQLLSKDKDGSTEAILSTALAQITLGDEYDGYIRLGKRIDLMRSTVAGLRSTADSIMKAAA